MKGETTLFATGNYTLTRKEVAARLGVSTSSVRRMEFTRLHPAPDAQGVWRFDPAELEGIEPKVPPKRAAATSASVRARVVAREGRTAARIFRMFARSMTLPQIVVVTKQPPVVVRELYRQWCSSLDEGEWERRKAQPDM
jgi:hypothetical protein